MAPLLHSTSLLSAAAAGALFSAIWQGALLVACVALCLRLMPGLGAAARSAIWLNVFALLVLLHLVPAFSSHGASAGAGQAFSMHLGLRWSLLIGGIWAMLSLWKGAQLLLSGFRLHRMARRATPVRTGPELRTLLPAGEKASGRSAELCTSDEVTRPCVFGFFRPRILVPPALIESLSTQELGLVLRHEMEHLRRGDDWSNLLQKTALVLFPLNPALYWVERRLCAERELACDDHVLRTSATRKAYAACLTHLAEYSMVSRGLSLVLGAWERHSELARRVHRILWLPASSMRARSAILASVGLVLASLAGGIALSRSPQLISFTPLQRAALQAPAVAPPAIAEAKPQQAPAAHATTIAAAKPQRAEANLQEANLRETNPQLEGGAPELVKAVLPQRPAHASHRSRAFHVREVKRNLRPLRMPPQQVWVVMTEWQAAAPPPQVVFTIARRPRASFAAVEIANGWLIVQI